MAAPPLLQSTVVIPAQAGIPVLPNWIPACAGMTSEQQLDPKQSNYKFL